MQLTLRVHDPAGTSSRDVLVDAEDESLAGDLVDAIVDLLGWPRASFNGDALDYRARIVGVERAIDPALRVQDLGLVHGAAIVIGPQVAAELRASGG